MSNIFKYFFTVNCHLVWFSFFFCNLLLCIFVAFYFFSCVLYFSRFAQILQLFASNKNDNKVKINKQWRKTGDR